MSGIRSLRIGAQAAVTLLLVAAAAAQAAKAPTLQPVTAGSTYDRNPVIVRDGGDTLLFFARSENPDCNRLVNCDADNSDYDLYVQRGKGNKWSAPELLAVNPHGRGFFRGRTIAATIRKDGTIDVFWASGGITETLYHLSRPAKSKTFTAAAPVDMGPDVGAFNVETVARGNDVFVYTEEYHFSNPGFAGIAAYRWTDAGLADRTEVIADHYIPKAIVDKRGTIRMAVTNGTVSVASSNDGLHFGPFADAASSPDGIWDPSLAQLDNGDYVLADAPNEADGSQQIEVSVSNDFVSWSPPVAVTQASDGSQVWWDFWPEAQTQGSLAGLYFASERPVNGGPAGTSHIWRLATK